MPARQRDCDIDRQFREGFMAGATCTIPQFIRDARAILDGGQPLEQKQGVIGERLADLVSRTTR
jgi:hypothetical protein